MKCINCNKTIPNSVNICPYCEKDPNMMDEISLGKINNDVYDEKMDIKVNVKEKKNHKKLYLICGSIGILVLLIGLIIISSIKGKTTNAYQVYTKFLYNIEDILEEKINNVYEGKYNLELYVNNSGYDLSGNYSYDLSKRQIVIDGKMDDPAKKTGGIIFEEKDLNYEMLISEMNMFFKSEQISNDTLFISLDNLSLYINKKIDYTTIMSSLNEAIKKSLKTMKFNVTSATYNGKSVRKTELIINNETKYKLFKVLYGELKEDSSFLSEISKITAKSEEELILTLENYIDNLEHQSKEETKEEIVIYAYSSGSNILELNYNNKYIISINKNIYTLKYYDDSNNELKLVISKKSEEHQDYIEYNYEINYSYKNKKVTGKLKLKENIDSNMIKKEYKEYKNVNDLAVDETTKVKNNINYYFKTSDFVNDLLEFAKVRCEKGLNCTCEDEKTCICMYDDKMISCDYDLVK